VSLTLTTAPTVEPLTIDEVREHCRIDSDDHGDDAYLTAIITAARETVEAHTSRAMLTQTWTLKLDGFPGSDLWYLPMAPLQSVTSITYVDGTGTTQTWATSQYVVNAPAGPRSERGSVSLAYDVTYPTTRGQRFAVTVVFVAGYGSTAATVPRVLRQATLLLCGEMYERREEGLVGTIQTTVPLAAQRLLSSYVSGGW